MGRAELARRRVVRARPPCIVLPRGTVKPAARFGSLGSGVNCATSIDGVGAR